jgi:hypothetical protein
VAERSPNLPSLPLIILPDLHPLDQKASTSSDYPTSDTLSAFSASPLLSTDQYHDTDINYSFPCTPDLASDDDIAAEPPPTAKTSEQATPEMTLFTRHPVLFAHDADDHIYIKFFLTKVPIVLPYFEIFPNLVGDVFQRATVDQALFHTMLSVSHLIADSRCNRSLVPAFQHQTQALSRLQESISSIDLTETVAMSVAMITWINIIQSNRPALGQHIHGLYLIFQEINRMNREAGKLPTPLLMQIYRFAIRMDIVVGIMFFPNEPLFTPVLPSQEEYQRYWVRQSTRGEEDVEWTLASFALDDLLHRASHVASKAYHLPRDDPATQSQLQSWTTELLQEHSQWTHREIILKADMLEKSANEHLSPSPSRSHKFLHHPALRIYNTFYGNLLNTWRMIYIFIDLILYPDIGPGERGSKRNKYAIDICRTYASLPKMDIFPIGKIMTVFIAGVALGGRKRSPDEVEWLYEWVLGDLHHYFPLNRQAAVRPFPPLHRPSLFPAQN